MSDAIRNVTIRVKIEQVESTVKAPVNFTEQAAGFKSIQQAVQETNVAHQASIPIANEATNAAERNFHAMLLQAQAESAVGQSTQQATIAQRAQSVENIQGAGNALRAAAANSSFSGMVASLGQALVFAAKQGAQQSISNAAVATTARSAAAASEFQAAAIGHVSAAGARAATSSAALAASNVAAGAAARAAGGFMSGLASGLPQVAIGVAVVSLAVELGGQAWAWYQKSARTANDDIKEAVQQRLDAQKQSALIETAIFEEEIRRRGSVQIAIDRQRESLERYRETQRQVLDASSRSFQASVDRLSGDPASQIAALRNRSTRASDDAIRGAAQGQFINFKVGRGNISDDDLAQKAAQAEKIRFETQQLSGKNLLDAEKERFSFIEAINNKIRERISDETRVKDLLNQQLQIDLQSRDAARSRLQTIQEQIGAEQGRLQTAQERFAQLDPGEQARLKQIAEKAKGGGELSLQEAQALSQSGLGQGQASQAFQRIANKAGFQELASTLGDFDQIKQLQFQAKGASDTLKSLDELAKTRMEEAAKAGATIEKLYKGLDTYVTALIELRGRLDKLEHIYGEGKLKGRGT